MAIDKAVDSAVLDAGLKATANAIRGKTGDSALIEWKNADGFKAAVDAIEAGGVDFSGVQLSSVACGTFTPSSAANVHQLTHGLGKIPKIICVYTDEVDIVAGAQTAGILSIFSLLMTDSTGATWNAKHVTGKGNVSWGNVVNTLDRAVDKSVHLATTITYRYLGIQEIDEMNCILGTYIIGSGIYTPFLPITYKWFVLA